MSKSQEKRNQDLIQVHWATIFLEVSNGDVRGGLKDFELLELDQSPDPARYTASVQFSAGTSAATAIKSLRQIIEKIERNGFPETTRKMPWAYAVKFMKLQKLLDKTLDAGKKLHRDMGEWYWSLMEHAGEPGFGKYIKQVSKKLGVSEDQG